MPTITNRCAGLLSLLALAATLAACGRGSESGTAQAATSAGGTSAGGMKTLPAHPNPCDFVPGADAARLIGPLARAPWQAHAADDKEATPKGRACVYPLSALDQYGDSAAVVVEVQPDGATNIETALGMVTGIVNKQLGENATPSSDNPDSGWDYLGRMGPEIDGRVGHLAIIVRWDQAVVKRDSLVKLATLMRDRIPDLAFAADGQGSEAERGQDACALLTRAEAEAVLGPLAMPPYHSRDATAMADPTGTGCTFYAPGHRAFSIDVAWSAGKRVFPMMAGMTQTVESKTGAASAAADTLEGPWDQAGAGVDGTLYFLTGDRILTVVYLPSKADKAGAVALARKAVTRLGGS